MLIEADETDWLPGVDDLVSGTKDVYWTVPDDLSGYGFGCTVPGHYTLMNGTFT